MQRAAPQEFTRVLSSMCTEPHPAARDAAERFLATNPGDPETYQAVARLERRAVETLGDIADLSDPHGYVTSGGTEANIQAVRSARNRRRVENPNLVVPESAHFSFTKAADVLGVELRRVPTGDDHRANVDAARAAVDDDTVLVVAVAGSTEFGRVDPISELTAVAHESGAFAHVDAAWGGFYLPFTDHAWSFAHAPVDSMTIDPHKCGRAAVPAGGVLFRERAGLDALAVDTPYLESTSQATLTGTRSGAGVAAAAAAMDALWPDGYGREYERAVELAAWFAAELRERGFETADVELPLVAASVPEPLFERLREEGWRISRTESGELRVVCMPHVTREMLTAFLADIAELRAADGRTQSSDSDDVR